jgi:outer membrane protein OmpA-like peptidoglycan-associated protein
MFEAIFETPFAWHGWRGTRITMTNLYRKFFATGVVLLAMAFTFAAFTVFEARAQQQTPYYDLSTSEVSIDLSVLNDGGLGRPRMGAMSPSVGGGSMLMPGGRAPQSRLLVTPPRKPRVKRRFRSTTKRKSTRKVRRTTRKPAKRKKVAATPKRPKTSTRIASIKKTKAAPPPPPISMVPKTAKKAPPPPAPMVAPAPTPASVAKAKSAPVAQPKQQASIQPTSTPATAKKKSSSQSVLVAFQDKSAKVPAAMKTKLKKLAASIKGKGSQRLQLMAYAGGAGISPSKARRLSLSRALAVRSYLISTGVRSTRIDVRALGNKTTVKPVNRVDVTVVKR